MGTPVVSWQIQAGGVVQFQMPCAVTIIFTVVPKALCVTAIKPIAALSQVNANIVIKFGVP